MARYELTDEQWALLQGLCPKEDRGGRWLDHRTMLNGMLWILRSGAPWRDLPERYGKWQSVNHRFNRWRRDSTFDRIPKALQIRLDKQGWIDWDLWLVDGTRKGYSHDALRQFLNACGIEAVIPRRSNQPRPKGERFEPSRQPLAAQPHP